MPIQITGHLIQSESLRRVGEISGENVYRCMQCGTCTAVCPMADSMEITPRRAMLMLQHGLAEEVRESRTPWLCASCHTCQVRCPRDIQVPRVMEAVRQMSLRDNVDMVQVRGIPADTIAEMPQIALVSGFRKLTA